MSSEYSIHLGDKPIKGEVFSLGPELPSTVVRIAAGNEDHKFVLYVKDDRLLEVCLLFHKIAQDLAALLPDVAACCRCVPGTPDDQCAVHGYGAYKIGHSQGELDWRTHCHCPGDILGPQHGPNLHTHGGDGRVDTIMGKPYTPPVCPLCDEPSSGGEVHRECASREQCEADAAGEARREPTDTIPIDEHVCPHTEMGFVTPCDASCPCQADADTIPREEAAEHVEPPHRWG